MSNFVCFGEVLWDLFPEAEKIGGAPLNVALRLKSFNNSVTMISAVGQDEHGNRLLSFLKERDLNTSFIQINKTVETGKVIVQLDEKGSASYTIKFPSAWDYIRSNSDIESLARNADALIFGSLVMRNHSSRETLNTLVKIAKYKIFDVNLRPPHFSTELLVEFMNTADFVKFNDEEIVEIGQAIGFNESDLNKLTQMFAERFNLDSLCVTRGDKGALLYKNNMFYDHLGFSVKVVDTVGAGDSFLATLINGLFNELHPNEALEKACAVGAMVAGSKGANPYFSDSQIKQFIETGKISSS